MYPYDAQGTSRRKEVSVKKPDTDTSTVFAVTFPSLRSWRRLDCCPTPVTLTLNTHISFSSSTCNTNILTIWSEVLACASDILVTSSPVFAFWIWSNKCWFIFPRSFFSVTVKTCLKEKYVQRHREQQITWNEFLKRNIQNDFKIHAHVLARTGQTII